MEKSGRDALQVAQRVAAGGGGRQGRAGRACTGTRGRCGHLRAVRAGVARRRAGSGT